MTLGFAAASITQSTAGRDSKSLAQRKSPCSSRMPMPAQCARRAGQASSSSRPSNSWLPATNSTGTLYPARALLLGFFDGTGSDDVTGVTVSNNGIELQDREFVAAIREGREPNSSVGQVLDCYRVIGELALQLEAQDGWS